MSTSQSGGCILLSLLVITWGSLRTAVGSKAMTKRAEVNSMPQPTEAGEETFELLTYFDIGNP